MEFIYEVRDVLSKDVCEEIIQRFLHDEKRTPSTTFSGLDYSHRKSTNLWIIHNNSWKDILDTILNTFLKGLAQYKDYLVNSSHITQRSVNTLFESLQLETVFVNEMKEGEYYQWHFDDTNKIVDEPRRTFTCLLYLNTLEDHQDGCTEFMCGAKIKPEQGKLLIFPASWTYEHRGCVVKQSGIKYTCGCWVC